MEWLELIDRDLLLWVNQHYTSFLDTIMVFASAKFGWTPLYVLLLFMLYKKFGLKGFIISIVSIAVLITIADQTSVKLFKEVFLRYRPCHSLDIKDSLRLIEGCGGKFGFLSSHATNTTAVAVFMMLMLRNKWLYYIMPLYFILNGYSRIYLGKHYPSDVVAGTLLGAIIAFAVYWLFTMANKKLNHD